MSHKRKKKHGKQVSRKIIKVERKGKEFLFPGEGVFFSIFPFPVPILQDKEQKKE